ncbi:MAG: cytochrome b5-like heme/steroid binding domain-containing protein [Patescibacteria group bacterium]|jgi:cytochrome b involved in lipid metabolism
MKKILIVAINIIILVLLAIPVFTFVKNVSSQAAIASPVNSANSGLVNFNAANPGQSVNLTLAEVAKHNQANDCWLIINNQVYDLSSYVPYHPGGNSMLSYCGREATAAYNDKGGGGAPHSQNAANLLTNYFIGQLGQQSKNLSGQPVAPPAGINELNREIEDD